MKAKTRTWSNIMKGLKIEDELEIANSDKSENESEVVDSIEQFDSEESNHLKVKRTKGQRKSTMTQRSRRVEKHRRHNSEGAKMSWLCLLASALNSSHTWQMCSRVLAWKMRSRSARHCQQTASCMGETMSDEENGEG